MTSKNPLPKLPELIEPPELSKLPRAAKPPKSPEQLTRGISTASVLVTTGLLLLKILAFVVTGSAALLASMLDSGMDLLASGLTWFAIRYAQAPPDKEHPFGHGKAEPFAALIQALLIGVSALMLLLWASGRLLDPQPLASSMIGVAVMLVATVVTLLLVRAQRRVVKATESLAVHADSMHFVSDIAANMAVLLALICSDLFGIYWLDPLVAIVIAVMIAISAVQIGRRAFDQLLDREAGEAIRHKIRQQALAVEGIDSVNNLKVRKAGPDLLIEISVGMNGDLPLRQAHRLAHAVEEQIQQQYRRALVVVHQEPT